MKTKPRLFVRWFASRNLIALTLAAAGVLLCAPNVQAANTRYAVATGDWNSTATWAATAGGASGASVPVAGDTAYISGGAFTVTVSDSEYCATLNVNTNGSAKLEVQSGGTLTMTGTATINNSANITVDSNGTFAGAVLTVTSGTFNNNGTATLTGNATGAGSIIQGSSASLKYGGTSTITTQNYSGSGNTVIYSGAAQTCKSGNTYQNLTLSGSGAKTLTGVTSISGTLTMDGSCTATLIASSTIGNITLNGTYSGTLTGAASDGVTGNVTVNAGTFTAGATMTVGGNLAVSGGTFKTANSASALAVTGTTTVNGGTLSLNGSTATATFTGDVTLSSGTFSDVGGAPTFAGNLILNGGTLTDGGGTYTFSGTSKQINGTASSLTLGSVAVTGSYSLGGSVASLTVGTALSGNGSFNGPVNVLAGGNLSPGLNATTIGTLTLPNSGATALTLNGNVLNFKLPASGTTCDKIAIAGRLNFNGVNTINVTAASGAAANTYTLMTCGSTNGTGSLVLPNGSTNMGNLTLAVSGTAVTLTVGAGGLNSDVWVGVGATNAWDTSSTLWTRNGTASQAYVNGDAVTFDDTSTNLYVTNGTSLASYSPDYVIFNNNSKNYTVSANIGGSGSLCQLGTGTTTLGGSNSYTGPTTISAGTLLISGQAGQYAGGFTIANGGTLQIGAGSASPGQLNSGFYAGNITNNGTINGNGYGVNPQTLSGTISGSGGVACNGQAANGQSLTLTGPNTFTGNVTVGVTSANLYFNSIADSGTSALGFGNLQIGSGNQAGSVAYNSSGATAATTSRTITLGNAANNTHEIDNNSANAGATLALNGPLVLTPASNGGVKNFTLGGSNSGTNTFASTITNPPSGILNLTKTGAGTWLLAASNSYSGTTTITLGILEADNNSALGTGLLKFNGGTLSNNVSCTLTNPVNLAATNATVGVGSGRRLTLGGVITNSFKLTVVGPGTLVLTNVNTYTNATTISSGTLLVNGSISGAVTNLSGATLGGNGTIGGAVTFADGSLAVFTNGSPLTLSSSLIIPGNTVVHLNLPSTPTPGDYTLATYNTSGSSGSFNSTPVIDSGSLGANTGTIVTGSGTVTLHVLSSGGGAVATTNQVLLVSGTPNYGNTLTFTATVYTNGVTAANATSNFVFKVDGAPVQTNGITSGAANFTIATLTAATHSITAEYSGDANYLPSTNTLSQTVGKATPTLVLTSSAQTNGYLSSVTFTASVSPTGATGSVQFRTNGAAFGGPVGLTSGVVSTNLSTLPRGTNTIVAEYSGDANYQPSTNSLPQVVTNHPPVAVADSLSWGKGTSSKNISIASLLANDTDADSDTITLISVDAASANGVTLTTNATYVQYTGALTNNDSFQYTISDGYGGTATALVSITATNTASAPSGSISVNNGPVTTVFFGITGDSYVVQRNTNLTTGVWVPISTNTVPASGAITNVDGFGDLNAPPYPSAAYYRLQTH